MVIITHFCFDAVVPDTHWHFRRQKIITYSSASHTISFLLLPSKLAVTIDYTIDSQFDI